METAAARWHDGIAEGWAALLAGDPNATPAHRAAVLQRLVSNFPGMSLATLLIEREGRLIGGVPVITERRAGLQWLHASLALMPGTPLAVDGLHAEVDRACGVAIAERARRERVVGGEWVVFRPDGPAMERVALEIPPGETRVAHTAVVDLVDGVDAAWARIDREARRELRLALRHGLTCAEEPGALDLAHALHVAQARGWGGHRVLPIELSRRLLATPAAEAPAARLFTARDGRGPLSTVLVLIGAHEWFAWWSGTHPDARRRHAFAALLWHVAQPAAAVGARRLNVGASAGQDAVASFKRSLGARSVPTDVRWIDGRHAPLAGRLVAALQGRVRRGRSRGERA